MSKDNETLSQIGGLYLLYKFRWIILLAILLICMNNDISKEYQEHGYSGMFDDVKYDEWTGEMIDKNKINSYKYIQPTKYFTNSKGDHILVLYLEGQLEEYRKIQGQKAYINQENHDKVNHICDELFNKYFEIKYTIESSEGSSSLYRVHLKDFEIGGKKIADEDFGATSHLRHLLHKLFKDRYLKESEINK